MFRHFLRSCPSQGSGPVAAIAQLANQRPRARLAELEGETLEFGLAHEAPASCCRVCSFFASSWHFLHIAPCTSMH